MEFVDAWIYERPEMSLVLGPRGGGKSYLRAFATHVDCLRHDRHSALILGGSEAQSRQIYNAIKAFGTTPFRETDLMPSMMATRATYSTGSEASFIPASAKSVRGPHVQSLCLDEVDEMDPELRDSSFGMCMGMRGISASVGMTSTWHRPGGPMGELIDKAKGGDFPLYAFCVFEVLKRCPDEISGPKLEHCPSCPLVTWCHSDRDGGHAGGLPKAKRSNGHYPVASLIQKARGVSLRTFEADYLCSGPRAEGLWFPAFSAATHVGEDAEYDPAFGVTLPIDCGTSRTTGAVFMQVRSRPDGTHLVTVFAEYLGQDIVSEANARAIKRVAESRCNDRLDRVRLDPASNQRTSIGPVVYAEYERVFGRRGLSAWPLMLVRDSLDLLDSFVRPASGGVDLRIHPRCVNLINAFGNYRRKKVGPVYTDTPEQIHPWEDMIDALRGGIGDHFPAGRKPPSNLPRVPIGRAFGRS